MSSDIPTLALALGRIPTGLYIVTTRVTTHAGDQPLGFVGSFVMQVGFEPPMLSVAIARGREHLAAIRAHGRFAVSVLDEQSRGVMGVFFKRHEPGRSPFDQVECGASPGGLAVLAGALAWLECRVSGEHATGDHVVLFGTVEHAACLREGEPAIHLRKNGLGY